MSELALTDYGELRMTIALPTRAVRVLLTVGLVMGVANCSSVSTNITDVPDAPPEEFAASLGIDLTQMNLSETGLFWLDIALGNGEEAVLGVTATVLLSGWLTDGTLFDTGTSEFVLLPGAIIPGLLEGIVGMKEGGTRKLVVPSNLAWGAAGNDPVPPNATVVFEVELQTVTFPQ